jgi:hypothetical protein
MSNFQEQQAHRAQVAAGFLRATVLSSSCGSAAVAGSAGSSKQQQGLMAGVAQGPGRQPVEVLSSAGGEFLHAPFDVSETRVCLAEQQAASAARWSRC